MEERRIESLSIYELEEAIANLQKLKNEASKREDFQAALDYKNGLTRLEARLETLKENEELAPHVNGKERFVLEPSTIDFALITDDSNQKYSFRNWMPDNITDRCYLCSFAFTLLHRKHHCRSCGLVCCGRCSNNHIELNDLGYTTPQRVCNTCFTRRHPLGKKATQYVYNGAEWIQQ